MLLKTLRNNLYFYKVVKTKTDIGPLPQMTQYQLYSDDDKHLSFWNDIPIGLENDILNCVVEIPKQKHGKFQVKKHIPFHPIMQDTRTNIFSKQLQLRFYSQFPLFNYGYVPQTWEQNIRKDAQGLFGDDDPIDICDLSEGVKTPGEIIRAKVLGAFCLIDQGETDWKLFVIDQQESKKSKIQNIEDVDPRRLESIKKWFKMVKVFDGKPANTIAYNEKVFNKRETLEVIKHTREEWVNLVTSDDDLVKAVRKMHFITQRTKESIKI